MNPGDVERFSESLAAHLMPALEIARQAAFDAGFDSAMNAVRTALSAEGHLGAVHTLDQLEAALARFRSGA